MKTYEDLVAIGENEAGRMEFIRAAIKEYSSSSDYRFAKAAELYYGGENPTINGYEKVIYDMLGRAHVDMWTANHKIASSFFTMVVDQEVGYLLGNGVRFGSESTKEKLGATFDEDVSDALEYARVGGASFGFWNVDHIDVFRSTEFCPLYGEETGSLMAGIRWWQLDAKKPLRCTLYEPDGFTEYIRRQGEDMMILKEKRAYVIRTVASEADGTIDVDGENYATLPIVPLYSNKAHKSALRGKRNTVDALDLASSSMVNNVDEGNLIYWVLTNAGGMDDLDDVKFIERLKTTHVAHAGDGDGAKAEAHTIEAPFQGTQTTIDMLIKRLYDDFQAFNSAAVTASDQSATAIRASYIPLDLKVDKIERQVTRFIAGILALAGIDDKPMYTRNQLINKQEETQTLVLQAQFLPEDYIREKLLTLNGDIDQIEKITEQIDADDLDRIEPDEADGEEVAE